MLLKVQDGSAWYPVMLPVFKTGGWQVSLSPVGSTPTRFRQELMKTLLCLSLITLLLMTPCSAGTDAVADRIVVVKSSRTMTLFSHGKALTTYKVALGGQPVGAKERMGDHKTPEGR